MTAFIFSELGHKVPIVIFTDSRGAQFAAQRLGVLHMRHLQLRYLILEELVQIGAVDIRRAPSTENTADVLTKAVSQAVLVDRLSREKGITCPSLTAVKSSISD